MDDKIFLAAFNNGVTSDLFNHKLYDQKPQTMTELIHSTLSFMNGKDTIIAKKKKKAKQVEAGYMHHPKQGPHPKKAKRKKRLRWQVYMQVRFVNLYEKWISYLIVHFDEKAQK